MILSAVFYCALFLLCYLLYYKRTVLVLTNGIPGVSPELFFGNVRHLGLLSGKALSEGLTEWRSRFGNCFQFFLGHQQITVFATLSAARTIWGKRNLFVQNWNTRERFRVLSGGLITLDGEPYKRHLRVVGPIFRIHKVAPYLPIIVKTTDRLLDLWKSSIPADQPYADVHEDLKRVTLDIFGLIAYGYDFNCVSKAARADNTRDMMWAVKHLVDQISESQAYPQIVRECIFRFSPKIQQAKKIIQNHLETSIKHWQAKHPTDPVAALPIVTSVTPNAAAAGVEEKDCVEENQECSASTTDPDSSEDTLPEEENNMMARMLHALDKPDGLSASEIMDELTLFVFGGYETTATTLAWFVFYMSLFPDKQTKMQDEIKQVLGDKAPTKELLEQMHVSENTVKECFRMAPTAPATSRTAVEDTTIDGFPVKAGTTVMVFTHALQHDPANWKVDPTQFVPERYEGEDSQHDYYAFAPFGGGQRACVGQQLAKLEAKVIAVRLLQKFTIKPAPGNTGGFRQSITVQPKTVSVFLVPN